ncbi:hypothetical protein OPKNFCMD_5166 [Methylobacterium crusticola]|uniref:Head-tail adaptor protein n=1 Tax=Methylobacterium crusticola TaxID=1697972 RepID=A0ABQ4R6G1_9HYPH|nr:hypothetical protein [Methylobacterium crusticola]GJD52401.1 hypothetical protein OPKNFCMD_5166 [Methylobacterium crusticola]
MGLLDGGLAALIGGAFAPLFRDATLHRAGPGPAFADHPVRVQIDGAREGADAPGLPGREVQVIVLTPGRAPPTPDDEITLADGRYRIVAVETDPAGSHALVRGRPLR